jgi:DNA-binding NarL/FixJ family response regulator
MSEKASGSSIRVMVVDDHELFRQGVSSILSREDDVEVVAEAENGRVAVQKAREYRPDVVLMDINMPVCDGLKATRQIKVDHPDIRILL